MKSNSRFIKQLLLLSIIIAGLGAILFLTVLKEYYLPVFPALLIFFASLFLLQHFYFIYCLQFLR